MTPHQPDPQAISDVARLLSEAPRVVVLTGAGISAESGLPTFRGADGIWKSLRPEEMASVDGFSRDPATCWAWYQHRRRAYHAAEPNAGHLALAEIARRVADFTLITQNVDRLHQRAGNSAVIELHGNAIENHCFRCGEPAGAVSAESDDLVPCSHCGGWLRPSVVWFGEMLPVDALEKAAQAARSATVFLSIGTSAQVYPAAQLPVLAHHRGATLIEINPEPTSITHLARHHFRAPSGTVLPQIVAALPGA
ncbi:NAD-dependent protein deacylase [bacterium]|nr:NAD-dependent protein deacylase [bacterium]